jgi:hypothetical protein
MILDGSNLSYQDYSSGGEPSIWRLDPVESFSDWVLEVLCEEDDILSTYHVHKAILAAGIRKSSYFVTLFQTKQNFKEKALCKCRFNLNDTAAEAFPAMLDYMYDAKLNFTIENAVALLHLADYFGIPSLTNAVAKFSSEIMAWDTAHVFLSEAIKYHDENTICQAMTVCVDNFHYLTESQICSLSPQVLDMLLRTHAENTDHHHWEFRSIVVAHYLNKKADLVNGQLVASLTDNQIMPRVCPSESFFFLSISIQYENDIKKIQRNDGSTLHQRSIDACREYCESVCAETSLLSPASQSMSKIELFRKLPSDIQNEVLKVSLMPACEKNRTVRQKLEFTQTRESSRKRPRCIYEEVTNNSASQT